jgi:hypothetical protein
MALTPISSCTRAICFALTAIAAQPPTDIGDVTGAPIDVECGPTATAVPSATVGDQFVPVHPESNVSVPIETRPLVSDVDAG